MSFYTYAHYTKDTYELFYIGKGQGKRAYTEQNRNKWWKRKVSKHGGFFVELLALWETEQEALEHEAFLIDTFDLIGVQLTNIQKSIGKETSGRKLSLETRQKMSDNGIKRWNELPAEEKLKKIALLFKSNKGKKKTEQHLKNLSKARTGLKLPNSWKKVLCKTTGVIYNSLTEASEKTKCDISHIVKCCKGKLKKTKNLEFTYV